MAKWYPNEYEQALMNVIEEAKVYCVGELELDHFEDGWYVMDYREGFEAAFVISKYSTRPVISDKTVRKHRVDVRRCCDKCGVAYVG